MPRFQLNVDGTPWTIYTPASSPKATAGETFSSDSAADDLVVPLLDFLAEQDSKLEAHASKLLRWLMESAPQQPKGPWAFPAAVSKHFDKAFATKPGRKKEAVTFYRFRSGDLRVVFFISGHSVVICTHGYIKRQQEVPKRQERAAIEAYLQYVSEFGS